MGRKRISEEEKRRRKAEYMKKYSREHRTQNNAARKRWREAHPEEARELNRKTVVGWQQRNREKYNAYHRAYREKKREELQKELDKKE